MTFIYKDRPDIVITKGEFDIKLFNTAGLVKLIVTGDEINILRGMGKYIPEDVKSVECNVNLKGTFN